MLPSWCICPVILQKQAATNPEIRDMGAAIARPDARDICLLKSGRSGWAARLITGMAMAQKRPQRMFAVTMAFDEVAISRV
jgi:hypothetical protein